MPKSGFDPQRHQRKLHRHNPLSKSGSASASSSAHASPASASSATLDALQQATKIVNGSSNSVASSSTPGKSSAPANDIVPLLANLPAPDNAASTAASINLADKVWSLASVSLLLTVSPTQSASEVKHHRKLLLSHNLVGRLLLALQSHTEVDVRREASGALRNLCVDSGIDVRNEVANKGGIPIILSAMRWASNALGFDASSSNPAMSFVDDTPTLEQDLEAKRALLAKPLDKLNKKEKRHAAKLAAALGKSLDQVAGQGLSAEDEQKLLSSSSNAGGNDAMDTSNAAAGNGHRGEPFLALDSNTRKGLLEMAENLVTVVWCLCESGDKAFAKLVTWKWLDQDVVGATHDIADELNGQALASWLSSAVALGSRAAGVLSTAGSDGARASSSAAETLNVLTNEELSLLLDLALASGNALCALTDGGEADFVDGLLARPSPTPAAASKSSKKKGPKPSSLASLPVPQSLDQQPASTTRCLSSIQTAITLLQACVQTDQANIDKLKRYVLSQSTMLGVLSAGVFRNIAAAVDSKAASARRSKSRKRADAADTTMTSSTIFVSSSSSGTPLKKFEESVILPTLTQLLSGVDMTKLAHDLDGRGDVAEVVSLDSAAQKESDESVIRAKMQGKAEEKAQTLMLALEVLAEMAGCFDSAAGGEDDGGEEEWLEDPDAEDEDEEMDFGDEDDDGVVGDSDGDAKEDDDMGVSSNPTTTTDTFADAVKRTGTLPFEAYAPILCHIVSTNTLTSALLTLSRPFEASFPSLTSTSLESDKPTSSLLRALHSRSLSVLNNLLLRLATFSPLPPSQPVTDPKTQRRISAFRTWIEAQPQHDLLEGVWTTVFEIAKGCASVPAVASFTGDRSADVGASGGEGVDGLTMVETCIGCMFSLARLFSGTLPLSPTQTVADATSVESEIISALTTSYTTSLSDPLRSKTILTLSTIARSPQIHPTLNAYIGNFLLNILESCATGSTTPESMLAAINGIIDVYADETSHYDAVFREGKFAERLRATVYGCKALVKKVDRRKQVSLREGVEEAVQNLMGFVEYRLALKF
ncbi:hypothetical protein PHSY_004165 [Pseudozyma hubeiensis SY62]|uniref:SYO1-like TPR repeats domain-containing protein n=1 Tax=Pseudozyma hubeiensis (strain SY62) TaxID=1305764 RepID=R9P566_PSEHS|nr:hypothetical protein PHSY_004165 [Pseudozyma hubeiensis SY62]GAC96583.1 hypothetical protein PHSY_004165 [Pseudozyma hubeiensis SY62]